MNCRLATGCAALLLCGLAPAASAELRWSAPETVSAPNAVSVKVSIDARGDVLATWNQGGQLAFSWRAPRGTWTRPRLVGASNGAPPAQALSPLGDATLAWVEDSRVVVATSRPGGSFSRRESIEIPGRTAGPTSLAVDDAGNTIVAWVDYVVGSDDPLAGANVAVRPAGGRFGEPQVLERNVSGAGIGIAVNPAGAAALTWTRADGGVPVASYRPPAGRFGPPEPVPIQGPVLATPVALDESGQAFVAASTWGYAPGVPSGGTTLAIRSPLGEWRDPVSLDAGGLVEQVTAEPTGAISFFVERADSSQRRTVAFTTRRPNGDIAGPTTLSSPDSGGTQVAMDLSGNMLGTWCVRCEGSARGTTIGVAERSAGGAFGDEEIVSPPDSIGSDAALNDAGQAVVAWSHNETPGDFETAVTQAIVREDPSLPTLPFPPDVDIDVPAAPELSEDGTLAVPVTCSVACRVRAGGLLFAGRRKPVALVERGASRRLRAKKRGRVRVRFGKAGARAARRSSKPWVSISVTARGRSPRPVTFSRRLRLRR